MTLLIYSWTNWARNFESNSQNAPTMSILTDRYTIKMFYRGKSNGEDWRVTVKNVRRVVVGMVKQYGREWVKAKILHWREGIHKKHCSNRIILSFLCDIF